LRSELVVSLQRHVAACVGIRHPEELSLARQLDADELKRNQGVSAVRRTQIPGMTASPNGHAPANNSYDSGTLSSPFRTTLTPQVTYSFTARRSATVQCLS